MAARQDTKYGFRFWLLIVAAMTAAYFIVSGTTGLSQFYRLNRDIGAMKTRLDGANRSIDSLRIEIERLKTDTAYIERVAREKLGMARKDEKIYKFPDVKK